MIFFCGGGLDKEFYNNYYLNEIYKRTSGIG